ncbi:2-keto-4-pentenoate hydratase [Parerythrobacter aurantius]|uniref:2-keto-4-pentenoate hydratase n=1 Tax=Parerythrobacter aurantius TaxID=3127706 RepID=UPI00324DA749
MQNSIAAIFVEARRTGAVVDAYPGEAPSSLEAAYRIQDDAIARSRRTIGGWKVGRIASDLAAKFGAERIAGPIFADSIVASLPGTVPSVPLLTGFAAIEAELLLRVKNTPPSGLTLAKALDYVDEVRFGLEVASSPFPGINDFGPTVTVSDFGNNFGLVLGPPIEDWRGRDLLAAPVQLSIDSHVVGRACLQDMLDGPFGAFCFLADCLHRRGHVLEPGHWVSTGAITGVHPFAPGERADATFDDAYSVACRGVAFVEGAGIAGRAPQ